MNDVPPSQPPSDDIDSFYRHASALDPSRPSERTRQAVLAHARNVAASKTRITTRLRRRERWWRPAVFGTLAAAALAGLLVLPQILTPRVVPRTTRATAQLSESAANAPASPASTPQVARPLAPPPPPEAAAPTLAAPNGAPMAAPSPPAAPAPSTASIAKRAAARDQTSPSEVESITVTGQRVAPRDLQSSSPVTAISSLESAPATNTVGANEALKAQVGSPQGLRLAAESGDLKRLQRFVDQLTDINSRDGAGRTALLLATLHGQTQAVEFLLAHGANPNTADAEGVTPLSAAMAGNHSAIIRMLKHAGAH
jgi:hypothetical protein